MAVFISVTTDAFEETFAAARGAGRPQPRNLNIRRPLRGLEVKKNTYGIIKVIDSLGNPIPIINSSSSADVDGVGFSDHTANFILVRVTEQRSEKQQIVETFGEDFIFFFGEQPRILQFQAIVLNTNDFNWKSEFWENYEKYLRGTRLLERNARLYISFDDVIVEGYMLNAQQVADAQNPYHLPLQFSVFVTNYAFVSNVGSIFITPREAEVLAASKAADSPLAGVGSPGGAAGSAGSLATDSGALASQVSNGGGGLTGFLAEAAKFRANASFSIQQTLENVKNTLYGRREVTPDGIGSQIALPPIANQAQFGPGERGVPIHRNRDEYIESEGLTSQYDKAELTRVRQELELRSPEKMEAEARRILTAQGIDVTRPSTNYLLLGRAAFAGTQILGSFGLRQADGAISSDVGAGITQGLQGAGNLLP